MNLIITTNEIKKTLLLERSNSNTLINDKIMSLQEVEDLVLGKVKKEAVLKMSEHFKIPLNYAKVIKSNVLYKSDKLKMYYNFLQENNLIEYSITHNFDKIKCINVFLNDLILNYFSNNSVEYLEENNFYNHPVYVFNDFEDEILWIANKISELDISLSKIKIIGIKEEYKISLKRIFKEFNIPINIEQNAPLNKTIVFIEFIENLQKTYDINESLKKISKGDVYNKIIDYFNKYDFEIITDEIINIIIDDFKNIKLKPKKTKNAVECIKIEDIYEKDAYYFLLGLTDSVPTKFKDEDFFTDKEKKQLNIFTSTKKNENSNKLFMNIFKKTKNLYLTYAKQSTFLKYNPSNIINDYKLETIDVTKNSYKFSSSYNKILFAKMLDDFIRYGEKNKSMSVLNNTYDIDFLGYSNKFNGINKNKIKYPIYLSYSSLKNYNDCAFKYYIEKILRLSPDAESLSITIGNVFHLVLSKIYEENFSFEEEYNKALNDLNLNFKDKFFLNNLKKELQNVIIFLNEFNEHTQLSQNMCEKKFEVNDIIKDKIHFKGFIDNIKYSDKNMLMALIDYKTGSDEASLDNINYGFNMQLPSYLYLVNHTMPNYKVIGLYLDKILMNKTVGEEEKKTRNNIKLTGYSTSNEANLTLLDSSYASSKFIKSLSLTKNGFSKNSKVLDENHIEKILDIATKNILEVSNNIVEAKFDINPKHIEKKHEKCLYCKYKDICFMTNEDIVKLKHTKIQDILKEE